MSLPLEIQENTVLVILGASGDLAKKKLVSPTPLLPTISGATLHFPAPFGLVSRFLQPQRIATTSDKT